MRPFERSLLVRSIDFKSVNQVVELADGAAKKCWRGSHGPTGRRTGRPPYPFSWVPLFPLAVCRSTRAAELAQGINPALAVALVVGSSTMSDMRHSDVRVMALF
ncbi:hypothetical protein GCM10007937_43310 [Mesorhizobium albiziae]|nr:hypothetical protein GCM10007937_43310 [Mesorhizobium albiziae]